MYCFIYNTPNTEHLKRKKNIFGHNGLGVACPRYQPVLFFGNIIYLHAFQVLHAVGQNLHRFHVKIVVFLLKNTQASRHIYQEQNITFLFVGRIMNQILWILC